MVASRLPVNIRHDAIESPPWSATSIAWMPWASISAGSAVLRDIDLAIPPRPDAGRHRRERLRQDGAAEDDHRAAAARPRGEVHFDGHNLAALSEQELTRQRTRFGFLFQQAALFDSMTIGQNVAFPLRQHTRQDRRGDRQIVLGPAGRGGPAREHARQEAGRAFRRHAEAGGPGPGAGPGPRNHALRRAHHRPGSDHERRDQRVDPQHPRSSIR